MTSKLEEAAKKHEEYLSSYQFGEPQAMAQGGQSFRLGARWLLEEARKRRTLNFHIITQEDAEIVTIKDLEELVGDK